MAGERGFEVDLKAAVKALRRRTQQYQLLAEQAADGTGGPARRGGGTPRGLSGARDACPRRPPAARRLDRPPRRSARAGSPGRRLDPGLPLPRAGRGHGRGPRPVRGGERHHRARIGRAAQADLLAALERQHRTSPPRRLGHVLVEMGKVDDQALREVMRQQTEDVVAELVRWKTGFFQFETVAFALGGEIEVDVKDFVLAEGFSPQDMLGDTAPPLSPTPSEAADAFATGSFPLSAFARGGGTTGAFAAAGGRPAPEAAPGREPAILGDVLPLASATAVTAEVTLRLIRYASQILSRGVLFVVRPDELRGIGQFGVEVPLGSAADQVRETVVPLSEPSVLREVVEKRQTFQGALPDSGWNRHLVHRLGGLEPGEVVVVPMIVGGAVAVLFYGDNLPDRKPIGPVDALEFMIAEAALAIERSVLEAREQAHRDKKPG